MLILKKVLEFLVGESCILDDRLESIRVYSLMVGNGYPVNTIGHADMLASCYNSESVNRNKRQAGFKN